MAKTLQLRRYTTSNLASITGASGELIVDTTKNAITVHDGSTSGGWPTVMANTTSYLGNTYVSGNIYATTITTTAGSGKNLILDPDGLADVILPPLTELYVQSSNTSVNTTSGAVIITGGLGVGGNVYANAVYSNGLLTTTGNGIGYATGSGGTVAQATNRATSVTLNKSSGQITLQSQAMGAGTSNTIVFLNSTIAANDFLLLNHFSGGTIGNYTFASNTSAGQANVTIRSVGTVTAEAPVIQYVLIKGATT